MVEADADWFAFRAVIACPGCCSYWRDLVWPTSEGVKAAAMSMSCSVLFRRKDRIFNSVEF